MTKSILDHTETHAEGARVQAFTDKDRSEAGPTEATRSLQRRTRSEPADAARAEAFRQIDRAKSD